MNTDEAAAQVADAMATLLAHTAPVREAVVGYRKSLLDAGIGEFAADQMATDFHSMILAQITKSLGLTP